MKKNNNGRVSHVVMAIEYNVYSHAYVDHCNVQCRRFDQNAIRRKWYARPLKFRRCAKKGITNE